MLPSGILAKVSRAHDQVEMLYSEIDAFFRRKRYELVFETNPEQTEIYTVVKERERVPLMWSILIGEIIHNMRSALDHLVWQLVIRETGLPPATSKTGFPIFLNAKGYSSDRGEKLLLHGVGAAAKALIKAAQPFETGEDTASPLWHLHELSNWDKHRVIALVVASRRSAEVQAIVGEAQAIGVTPEGPLEHDTVLGIVRLRPSDIPLVERMAKVKMETKITFHITIQEPAILGRPQVVNGLNTIGARVGQILDRIDKECF
jgi:hypothetical protein